MRLNHTEVATIVTKTCTCCNRELPVEQFWKLKGSKDGRGSQCIECWIDRKLKKKGLKPTKWCNWHEREEALSEFDVLPNGELESSCREACREVRETFEKHLQTTNESALELKNKLIADLQDRLTETEQTLRYKEQQVKQLQGRIAELEFRMKTANLFQRIFKTW
mgnify:CR=1 FL=1